MKNGGIQMAGISERMKKILIHLKSSEPKMKDTWMTSGKITKNKSFLRKDFRKNRDAQIEGLLLAIELLAKKCAYLESQLPKDQQPKETD